MTDWTPTAWLFAGLSVVLIRLGWGARRSVAQAGWALAAASLLILARTNGAWGVAMGFTIAMIVALALVLHAGWRTPAKPRRPARQADPVVLPHSYGDVGRRLAVFVLVVPVAFLAAQWLAFAIQALARGGAPLDADSLALALFVQPVAWVALMSWQMTLSNPARMVLPPAMAGALGAALWSMA